MHRASDSIGAIAAALAKAQVELKNPEKVMTATFRPDGRGATERSFRYAPLSSGLDLVRNSLGRHEIATVQTTGIDAEAGLVRLTTVLAHSSGEWVASDWPVCPISDTAEPRRMGAALTYARRYALFALVGIAGEDDLDASGLGSVGQPTAGSPIATGDASRANGSTVVLRRPERWAPRVTRPQLAPAKSAEARDALVAELRELEDADALAAWAYRSLPTKNSLPEEDARVVEREFEARLRSLDHGGDGRADGAPVTTPSPAASAGPGPVQLRYPKTRRVRSKKHLAFVASQPCLVCGRSPADAHHLGFMQPRALGRKVSDEFTVPLCRLHHRALHDSGSEGSWWQEMEIDPVPIAERLWTETRSDTR